MGSVSRAITLQQLRHLKWSGLSWYFFFQILTQYQMFKIVIFFWPPSLLAPGTTGGYVFTGTPCPGLGQDGVPTSWDGIPHQAGMEYPLAEMGKPLPGMGYTPGWDGVPLSWDGVPPVIGYAMRGTPLAVSRRGTFLLICNDHKDIVGII